MEYIVHYWSDIYGGISRDRMKHLSYAYRGSTAAKYTNWVLIVSLYPVS